MAEHDDEKVEKLLKNLDKEFAKKYLCNNDETEAEAYVDNHSGLKKRRDEEYKIYKEGMK